MDEVIAEAKRRGIEVIAAPTMEVWRLQEDVKKGEAYAIVHCRVVNHAGVSTGALPTR